MKGTRPLIQMNYITRLIMMMAVVFVLFALLKPDMFLKWSTFNSIAVQFPEYGIMALGVMLAFISGCIDMSFIYLANLCAIISVIVMRNITTGTVGAEQTGLYVFLGILAALGCGMVAGIFNGFLISSIKIPPILATLATGQIFSGISKVLTKGKAISGVPALFSETGSMMIFGILPMQLLIYLVVFLLVGVLLKYTVYGSNIYLLGSNRTVAYFSGMRVSRHIIVTFMICGMLSAIGGLLMTVSYNSAKPDYGSSYLMQCILIVVLGGVSPNGGVGKILGVLLATITVQMISSGFNMFSGISIYYRTLLTGVLLVIMMIINYLDQNPQMKGMFRKRR